jgi:hypothetical protein
MLAGCGIVYKLLYTYTRGEEKGRRASTVAKFMLSIREESYQIISAQARERGVSVQELLRAVILPEWVRENMKLPTPTRPFKEGAPQLTRYSMASKQPDPFIKVPLSRSMT